MEQPSRTSAPHGRKPTNPYAKSRVDVTAHWSLALILIQMHGLIDHACDLRCLAMRLSPQLAGKQMPSQAHMENADHCFRHQVRTAIFFFFGRAT
jgi:hypothetical protein